MSELNYDSKTKTLIIECDCGVIHKVKKNNQNELELLSFYKPKKEIKDATKKERESESELGNESDSESESDWIL